MNLNPSNYYSQEANEAYWSASWVKSMMSCEASAMAELRGEYTRPDSQALMVGSYVDAAFEGTLDLFCAKHPEILKRDGSLKSEYCKANEMIQRAQSDPIFMDFMDGEKQHIVTGELFGMPFKCKFDVYQPGNRIVDLKTTKDMKPMYKPEQGRVTFAEYWNWPLQMAIYQAVEGHDLPVYLAVITKEDPPDLSIIQIPQELLNAELKILESKVSYYDAIRQGIIEPARCEQCAYCRSTKRLTGAISLEDIMMED